MRHVLLIFSSTARLASSSIYYGCKEKSYKSLRSLRQGLCCQGETPETAPPPYTIAQAFSRKCKTKYKVSDACGALLDKIVKFNELWIQVKTKFVRKLQYCFFVISAPEISSQFFLAKFFCRIFLKIFLYFFQCIIMTSPIVSQTNPWDYD